MPQTHNHPVVVCNLMFLSYRIEKFIKKSLKLLNIMILSKKYIYFKSYRLDSIQKLFLLIMIIVNIYFAYFGLITLNNAPVLKIDSNTLFSVQNVQKISSIGTVTLNKNFFLRLPEFYNLKEENTWWSQQRSIHRILSNSKNITVQYTSLNKKKYSQELFTSQLTFKESLLLIFPIYLSAFIILLNAISLTIKHRSESSFILCIFLCFFSLYFISAAPLVCRQWTLDFSSSKILIYCHYISSGGLVSLIHYSMIFPKKNILIKKLPTVIPSIFYLYIFITSTMYISGQWAFDTTMPMLLIWIIIMIINFSLSIVKEHDIFLKKQIILSLIVPVLVGIFFAFLTAIPELLGNSSLQFTLFSLFSLIMPFSLISAMDNILLYQQRISLEKSFMTEKEHVRQALHDHTLSTLSHISHLSDSLQNSKKLPQTQQIGIYARTCSKQIRDFLWISGEHCTKWHEFSAFMREYGYNYFDTYQIDFDFDLSEIKSFALPNIDIKNCLYHSFISSLNNITQHSGATTVHAHLIINPELITLIIHDNGCGFSENEQKINNKYGLNNIKKRVKNLGGSINIISSPHHGTSIKLNLPNQ